jgi:hypothetical protein
MSSKTAKEAWRAIKRAGQHTCSATTADRSEGYRRGASSGTDGLLVERAHFPVKRTKSTTKRTLAQPISVALRIVR